MAYRYLNLNKNLTEMVLLILKSTHGQIKLSVETRFMCKTLSRNLKERKCYERLAKKSNF